MIQKLKVGIIGLGEVVQSLHLPTLSKLHREFEVVAVCDASATTRNAVGAHYGIANILATPDELVAVDEIDAVLVATPDAFHGDQTIASLAAQKHVFVEKPICVTLSEAEQVVDATTRSDRVVQVGYMRNFSPALHQAKIQLSKSGPVRLVKLHDLIGPNQAILDQVFQIERGNDISEADSARFKELQQSKLNEVLGPGHSDAMSLAYRLLIGLGSHDLSAMNCILGRPSGVDYASISAEGRYISAVLNYGDFCCHFSIGIDSIPRYDTAIEIFTDNSVFRVSFDAPYVAHLPQHLHKLTVTEDGNGISRSTSQLDWGDAFSAEWLSFHSSVTNGTVVMNGVENARDDLRLINQIVEKIV